MGLFSICYYFVNGVIVLILFVMLFVLRFWVVDVLSCFAILSAIAASFAIICKRKF